MMKYSPGDIEVNDYVLLLVDGWHHDGWYRVTGLDGDYVELADSFGTPTAARYSDIIDLKLPSEMDYAF